MHGAAEVAGHRVGHAQRVPDGFLDRLGGGEEQRREMVGGQGGDGDRGIGVQRHPVGGGEGAEDVAAAVGAEPAHAGEADTRPLGEATALVGQQRGVGGEHDDDRPGVAGGGVVGEGCHVGADGLAHVSAVEAQQTAAAVVGLHQRAYHERSARRGGHAAGGADTAFELVADHPGAAADVALGHGRGQPARAFGIGQRGGHMFGGEVEGADVVEEPVVGFAHDG